MSPDASAPPRWCTSSFGSAADTTPMELSALGEHLLACNGDGARRVAVQCGAQTLRGFVMARLVSAATAVGVVVGGTLWLLL